MRTGLFFGTFNPVHRGHESLSKSFLSSGLIDDLWIVLTPFPPHKIQSDIASLEDRRLMLDLVFSGRSDVEICIPEKNLPPPHYTVKSLDHLAGKYPDRRFVLCIGGDTLQTLPEWYRYEAIADKAELLVAGRPGASRRIPAELTAFTIQFCDHKAIGISSSVIRQQIATKGIPPADHLHPDVEKYIRDHKLYRSG